LVRPSGLNNNCEDPYCQLITCGDYEYLDNGVCRRRTCECRQQLLINGFCGDCAADETARRVTITSTNGSLNFERYVCERLTCPADYRLVRPTGANECTDPYCQLISCGDYEYLDNGVCRVRECECRQQLLRNGFCGDCAADEVAKRVSLTGLDVGTLSVNIRNRNVCERLTCPADYALVRSTAVNGNRCEDPYCQLITCGDYEYLENGRCRRRVCGNRQ
jgi:hypothetical protein